MRALLIPKRELAGELRILVDARFDLLRAIDEARLGKIEDYSFAVICSVASCRNPADQVIAVRWRERQYFNELQATRFAGQSHQHKVRLHLLRRLIALA